MSRKNLLELKHYRTRLPRNLDTLKFYKANRALYFLDRDVPRDEMNITVTHFKIDEILSIKPVSSKIYAYCPLKHKTPKCPGCEFLPGMYIDLGAVMHRATFDQKFVEFFILTQLRMRTDFPCNRNIIPGYKDANTNWYLMEITPNKENISVYCWLPSDLKLRDVKKIYAGRTVRINFMLTKLSNGKKVLVGEIATSYSEDTYLYLKELELILSSYLPNKLCVEQIKDNLRYKQRFSKKDLQIEGMLNTKKMIEELINRGFLTKNHGSLYRRRKLGTALRPT